MKSALIAGETNRRISQPKEVIAYVRSLAPGYTGEDRRDDQRYPLTVGVMVTPVEGNGQPTGSPLAGVTRDISLDGCSMLFADRVAAGQLLVEISGLDNKTVRVILNVVRQRRVGPFWELTGRFAAEIIY